MGSRFTRRRVMTGAASLAAVGVGGAGVVALTDVRERLYAYVKSTLPGVTIDEESLRQCIDDVVADWSLSKKKLLGTTWLLIGVENSGSIYPRLGVAPRVALTSFLTNSNFFSERDPRTARIVYDRARRVAACRNPFATNS